MMEGAGVLSVSLAPVVCRTAHWWGAGELAAQRQRCHVEPGVIRFPQSAVRIQARDGFAELFPMTGDVEVAFVENHIIRIPDGIACDEVPPCRFPGAARGATWQKSRSSLAIRET